MDQQYIVAADAIRGDKLFAAAVIYPRGTPEPTFTYEINGRKRTSPLYQKRGRIPSSLASALSEYVKTTALGWAVIVAHPDCPTEKALALAVVRAVERWFCRTNSLPRLEDTQLVLPSKKQLCDLPGTLTQVTASKDWRTGAALALCRHKTTTVLEEEI